MEPRELADAISKFCIERLGVLALELEANEAGGDGIIADAKRVTELIDEAQRNDSVPLGLLADAMESSRLLGEHGEARVVFEAVKQFMLELHEFMYGTVAE
jgi:hypothetical protein